MTHTPFRSFRLLGNRSPGNEAFEGDAKAEVARILRDIANRILRLDGAIGEGVCRDANGNSVGTFVYIEEV